MVRRIRAAVTAGIRPCSMVFRVQPKADWEELDFKLMEAYQVLEDETCPKCGNPVWLCRSVSDNIEWTAQSSICYATRRIEEARESKKSKGDKKASKEERSEWGKIEYAVPRVPAVVEGHDLPSRTDYFNSLTVE